jgi:small basic protein
MGLIESIIANMATGCAVGILLGLLIAMFTPDGIWPQLWAGLVLVFVALGAVIGLLEWLF